MVLNITRKAIWRNSLRKVPSFSKLGDKKLDKSIDVCIIGSGITGLSCALKLHEKGKSFIIIDKSKIASGVSLHTTAKVTSQHRIVYNSLIKKHGLDVAKGYAAMNEYAIQDVKNTIKNYNIDCHWNDAPHIVYTVHDKGVENIKNEVEACKKVGLKAQLVDNLPELPYEIKMACQVENQGYFNPYEYCLGIADYLKNEGYGIYEDSRVTDISFSSPHEIKTKEGGFIKADNVILATQLPILDRSGHFASCHPQASYCIAVTLNDNDRVIKNMYISDESEGFDNKSLRPVGFQDDNGDDILIIAGNGHPVADAPNHNDTELQYEELINWGKKNFNIKKVICRWSSHDYITNDSLPYIGYLHYGTKSLYCGTGYKKWGFTCGVGASKIICDLILDENNKFLNDKKSWHSMFDARRWDITKSIKEAVSFQAFVAKHFFKDRIEHYTHVLDIDHLKNDNASICKDHNGKIIAAYRDNDGNLHKVSYVCQHLGCHVKWNQADKTWDCPCHGSRYNIDGELLNGPSVKDLERYS